MAVEAGGTRSRADDWKRNSGAREARERVIKVFLAACAYLSIFTTFGIVVVLFWLDWRLALAAFSIVPFLLLLTFWFKRKVRESYREVRVNAIGGGSEEIMRDLAARQYGV